MAIIDGEDPDELAEKERETVKQRFDALRSEGRASSSSPFIRTMPTRTSSKVSVGHTYLIGTKTLDDLAEAFQRRIMPLLQEYFYDDWTKIRSVLGGNPFICEVRTSNPDVEPDRPVLELIPHDDDGWRRADSYKRIYAVEQADDD